MSVVIVGMLALLVGVTVAMPWCVERLTGLVAGAGPLSWQLATRRLQLGSGTSTRSVNGIVVAVAGAIALQTLFAGITRTPENVSSPVSGKSAVTTQLAVATTEAAHADMEYSVQAFAAMPGVVRTVGYEETTVTDAEGDSPRTVRIADCAALRILAELAKCVNGDAFLVVPRTGRQTGDTADWKPGTRMRTGSHAGRRSWVVPARRGIVRATTRNPQGPFPETMLFLTPAAADSAARAHTSSSVSITYRPGAADVQDYIRTAAARLKPQFNVAFPHRDKDDRTLGGIRRALLAGVLVTLLLISASMLLGALEQIRDRGRVLAVLMAFGTPRRILMGSVLWQTALPVAIGLALAALVGTLMGRALLGMVGRSAPFDWQTMTVITGIGAAAVLLVTALTLPALRRTTQPEGLRFE
ncbi:ABC transporter permease [Streptomyces tauricus]|uniref:ABC transporter permease n=1 Tax=Streptomyces tauricus TaxID=68274 RepID=UPI00343F6097